MSTISLVDAGNGLDQARQTNGQGGACISRCMGAAAGDFRMRGSCARGDVSGGSTYESAMTCRFFKCCMEVVRVVDEGDAFVHVMVAEDGAGQSGGAEEEGAVRASCQLESAFSPLPQTHAQFVLNIRPFCLTNN